ncbi:hypothetical protein HMPREF9103_02339 [Lentilactobacillus parafarraginis F0439]|uniref:Uncharacterized protein n=1 Tax=Lentilactobacillus parafarraginis F0439 TaxID=797515 RepID=G9ZRH8_9LACO|nr:hypothetical protein [Lentilactobacillus parafarraginis]EHL96599.1 hypothetical protein HMPREF9103_02339 [Lentilactobacillus parafarraginis F0439]MBV0930441.1 hypothetical protein [Lentilactobacillus dabitei]
MDIQGGELNLAELFSDDNNFPKIKEELRSLNRYRVEVGVMVPVGNKSLAFLQMIATVNEFGAEIYPKNGPYLIVPMRDGTFYKLKHVKIPERSFLRDGVDLGMHKIVSCVEDGLAGIMSGDMTARELYEAVGLLIEQRIKDEIVLKTSPHNAALTIENKGKDDPLVDTGALHKSIGVKVIEI